MSEPTPLEHARAVKLRLRAASKKAAEARKFWTSGRTQYGNPESHFGPGIMRHMIGQMTIAMWDAETELAAVAEEWRACLAARAAMPAADRWDLAALERWAAAQDKAGTP